jgi:ribonuclease HIII
MRLVKEAKVRMFHEELRAFARNPIIPSMMEALRESGIQMPDGAMGELEKFLSTVRTHKDLNFAKLIRTHMNAETDIS